MSPRTPWLLLLLPLAAGCSADRPLNPSFPLTVADARAAVRQMQRQPAELQRPVVVLGGFMDPGVVSVKTTGDLRKLTGDPRIIGVGFLTSDSFEACRRKLIEQVEATFPCADPDWTVEVDVVAVSMGGLIARYAAAPPDPEATTLPEGSTIKRLRIARLFTLGTPHRGARRADLLPPVNRLQLAMRTRSRWLARLDEAWQADPYPIFAYVRLDDRTVGEHNTAPPGQGPWWVANQPLEVSHWGMHSDPRLLADVARRLRGEPPFTSEPPAALPW